MRFTINLTRESQEAMLPINYQYELSSLIYKTIDRANSAFSAFLHQQGYLAFGNKFRLFTFSRLSFDKHKVIRASGRIHHIGKEATFEISFLVDRASEEFIKGLFMDQVIVLGDKFSQVTYAVAGIYGLTPPEFKEVMTYRSISPLFIRQKRADGGEDYLQPSDKEFGNLLVRNLCSKTVAYASQREGEVAADLQILDFEFKALGKVYQNGVTIKQHSPYQTKLIGYLFEFELKVSPSLQEIGYYAGFGHLGSQGFGCVRVK